MDEVCFIRYHFKIQFLKTVCYLRKNVCFNVGYKFDDTELSTQQKQRQAEKEEYAIGDGDRSKQLSKEEQEAEEEME